MHRINWGIIGCGSVTEVKSGPAFNKVPGSKVVAVMRRSGDKARDYAQRHGVPKWTDNADALIDDPEVHAVYVATPPDSHCDYTIRAARAGKPVYVEKPMARTFQECERMIAACREANVPLFVAYYRRCLPNFLKVKDLVDSGAIGEVRFATIQLVYPAVWEKPLRRESLPWRVQPEIAGGGYFFDLASHQLDFLDFLFGPIESTGGVAENQADLYPAEDIVSAHFRFASGVVGSGVWCFTVEPEMRQDRMEVVGSKGRIVFAAFDRVPFRIETARGVQEFELPTPEHIQQPLIQSVVDELNGRGTCPSTGITAARTSWVMDQVIRDYRKRFV
ncbi:MAG: Gfo/Idh/MocA family protein [bacterium]